MTDWSRSRYALVFGLTLLLARPPLAEANQTVWTWTTRAVQMLVKGETSNAVAAIARARKAKALPELDALVGIIGLAGAEVKAGRQQLEHAIARGSTEPLVFYWAGRAALRAGAPHAALKRLTEAQAIGGELPALRMGQALVLARVGRTDQAARSLAAVARLTPNLLDPRLYPTPTSGAIEMLGVIARRFPNPVLLWRTQGHLSWQSGDVLSAARRFRVVLAKRPRDVDALRMLARCAHAVGDTAAASKQIEQAIDLDPDSLASFGVRGLLLRNSDPVAAARDLQKAAAGSPRDVDLLIALGQACALAQKPKCARKFFSYAIRLNPRNAAAHFGRALQQQLAGKLVEAERSFLFALALQAGNPRYHEGAANFYQIKGDKKRAKRLLRAARQLKPFHQRFERLRQRAADAANRTWVALSRCGCGDKGCRPEKTKIASCHKAVRRLSPRAVRTLFRAHLTTRAGRRLSKTTKMRLAEITARNRVRRLLLSDPTILKLKGKTVNGAPYVISAQLPMVLPRSFR